MQPIQFFAARAEDGALVPGATVDVFVTGTQTRAALFADSLGNVPLINPILADKNARVFFYSAITRVDIQIHRGAYVGPLMRDVVITDPDDVLALTNGLYRTVAQGLAATVSGKTFQVIAPEDEAAYAIYENVSGAAVDTGKRIPTRYLLDRVESASRQYAEAAQAYAGRNFGPFTTDPTTNPLGQPLVAGDRYLNTAWGLERVYTGIAWYTPNADGQQIQSFLADPSDPNKAAGMVGYSPPGFPAVITNVRELFDSQRQMGVPITDKLFGAGPGKTTAQNTVAIQAAHDAAAEAAGGVIQIPGGTFNYNEVRLSEENIHIQGPGWLANGRLWIGDLGTEKKVLDFRISTNFTYDTLQADNIPIKLLYAVKGSILFSRFKNCDKAIYAAPAGTWQQVARITTAYCEFDTINYGVYLDRNVGYLNYETADLRFLFNTYLNCQKDHVYGRAVDGISLIGEKYFFPGFSQHHPTKGRNIDLQHVNWVHISNCDLFEAGLEAIKVGNFQNLKIGPNNIAWPGQRVMSSAILLHNGDRTGATWIGDVEQHGDVYCISSIDSQNIMFPTKHGIEIDQYSGHIQVAPSQIRNPGNAGFYYGTEDLNSINHYAVDSSGPDCRIDAQLSDRVSRVSGARSVQMRQFLGNENQTSGVVNTVTATTAVINVDGVDQVNLSFPSAGTITNFVGFFMWDMKKITVTSFNGNATIQNSSLIHTTSGANITLAAQKPVQFERIANAWYQV